MEDSFFLLLIENEHKSYIYFSFADSICKQLVPRLGLTVRRVCPGSKLIDDTGFPKIIF